jgi:ABC-2 type transport system permease protein
MNLQRTLAIIERDLRIVLRLKWRLVEVFYFPITSVIIWGFFTLWTKQYAIEAGFALLAINIFWSFAYQSQSGANMQLMEDRWNEEFKKLVTTPLRPGEYLIGKTFSSLVFTMLSFFVTVIISYLAFGYTVIVNNTLVFFVLSLITVAASVGIGILIASFIIVFGNEYSFFSWSVMQVFMLFSAPFFPLSTYPYVLQLISKIIPFTWVFESIRSIVTTNTVPNDYLIKGAILGALFVVLSVPVYSLAIEKARKNGKLIKIW